MTNDEKCRLAVKRELAELKKTVESFDVIVENAKRLAADTIQAAERLHKVHDDARVANALDDLDYAGMRGKYIEDIGGNPITGHSVDRLGNVYFPDDVHFPCAHKWMIWPNGAFRYCGKCDTMKPIPESEQVPCEHDWELWPAVGEMHCLKCYTMKPIPKDAACPHLVTRYKGGEGFCASCGIPRSEYQVCDVEQD